MSNKSFIDSVKVGSPCSEKWEEMAGNDRVRFCSHCAKDVNDLSTMTRKEASRFVRASDGKICIRYRVDPVTRRPMFAEQLLQITRRAPGLAAGALTATMAASTASYAQVVSGLPVQDTRQAIAKLVGDRVAVKAEVSAGLGSITGTVTDPQGAVIQAAVVKLYKGEALLATAATSDEGVYNFDNVEPGSYRIDTSSPGFVTSQHGVDVATGTASVADASLGIGINETVEVRMDVQMNVGFMGGAIAVVEYRSPLSQAVADDDKELVRELLTKGEKVNAREDSYSKITPIFLAVETGDIELVQMLLDAGAKVNVRSESKETPLMRLDQDATPELVDLLVRYRAKVNAADDERNTPLIHAAEYSTPLVAQALIAAGADVNAQNSDGETALMKTADRGDIDTMKALIAAGVWVNTRDKDGDNAWVYADTTEAEDLLISFGIDITPEQRAKHDGTVPDDELKMDPTPTPSPAV